MKRVFLIAAASMLLSASAQPPPLRHVLVAEHARSLDDLAADLGRGSEVAIRAALAIGRTKDPRGAAPLRAHLAASEPALRAMVAYALGLLADPSSLRALRRDATEDPNGAVRYAAVDAIGRIAAADPAASAEGSADLLRVLSTDDDAVVRAHAAANLDAPGTAADKRDIALALQRAFGRERDEAVRWHIMWTLSRAYPTVTDRDFFASARHDASDLVRLEAVRGLGRTNDPAAAPLLAAMLDDPSWRVQEEATEALRRLRREPPTQHLDALQAGLHLPPMPETPATPVSASPRPRATKLVAPTVGDVRLAPPLRPQTAASMNGPMPGRHPRVRITTTKGILVLRLYPEWAPFTVANFLKLANARFFDGNRWFRIVPDFVVQTGDPTNTGDHDAGYTIGAEENPVEQRAGVVSMGLDYDEKTNTPKRDSAGSQFYITLSPQLHLDRAFTVFGEIESGLDVLPRLVEADMILTALQIGDD